MANRRSIALLSALCVNFAVFSAQGASPQYSDALAAYGQGRHEQAARMFRSLVESETRDSETLKAHYFLARSDMKLSRWEAASSTLIKIHSLSPAFFREWSGDFLLGVCRRAQGKE